MSTLIERKKKKKSILKKIKERFTQDFEAFYKNAKQFPYENQ